MARMMKAAVVHTFGRKLTIEDVPIPTPGPGEAPASSRQWGRA